jgi:hypothetical protein
MPKQYVLSNIITLHIEFFYKIHPYRIHKAYKFARLMTLGID